MSQRAWISRGQLSRGQTPPLCHLTLIFNIKVNKNTFFENAKNEFLYISRPNDERISIVNDKKDRPIEQWELAKFWPFGKTRTIQPKRNIFQIFFSECAGPEWQLWDSENRELLYDTVVTFTKLTFKILDPVPAKTKKNFYKSEKNWDLPQNFMSFLKIWRNLEVIFLPKNIAKKNSVSFYLEN